MTAPHELSLDRFIAAAPARVWTAMTERMPEWWCPRPWRVEIVELDLRSTGRFATVMHGPNGETMPGDGVLLEVVPGARLVFTDAFKPGWIPDGPFMVGILEIAAEGDGTRYKATARHWTAEARAQHEAMGFATGWGIMADQLAELVE